MSDPPTPRVTAIREALAAVLAGVDGIQQSLAYPPTKVAINGTAWVGYFDTAITAGNLEIQIHQVPITVWVRLNSQHKQGLAVTEPTIDAVLEALRQNQTLGLPDVHRVQAIGYRQGVWEFGGNDQWIGFQVSLEIKEAFGVEYN